ncbi:hypothetical protein MJ575_04825 [Klebsiella pneumoniae]|nr:hypothetical protein MJ575_04825 [Klebsiella pneumoniae]
MSGEGELVRKASFKVEEDGESGTNHHRETAAGLVLSTTCFLLAYVVAKKNSAQHWRWLFTISRGWC